MLLSTSRGTLVIAAVCLATFLLVPNVASAQAKEPWPAYRRADGYTYFRERKSVRPEHGFSGFAGPPLAMRYCDYQRIPNRTCDKKGCRATSWTLKQYCL